MSIAKRWVLREPKNPQAIETLKNELGVDDLIAKLLVDRGLETFDQAKRFFRPSLDHLHDPFLMKDMDIAVNRVLKALESDEKIMIYGDYDVDGTTSVSLVYAFLSKVYKNLITYIPDRYKEGYGVSTSGIDLASAEGVGLIIALDCGIKAIEKVEYAKSKGIDFIICDHHRPGAEIPKAVAVLDPKRKDCDYPYKELSGCGVGFKLMQALRPKIGLETQDLYKLLDLLAVSIGADIVPITGENRILAHFGLKIINEKARPGLEALIEVSGRKKPMSITDVVFTLGPRINAAGRMDHGKKAVDLLCTLDPGEALKKAKKIDANNTRRRGVEKEILEGAVEMIHDLQEEDRKTTVLFNPEWNKGVIGIVASKLIDSYYYRPTIIFTESNGVLAASARSVYGFDVYKALEACEDLLEQFGGHMYAAGMSLKKENFPAFKARFEEVVASTIDPELLIPEIQIDAEIELNEITPKNQRILNQFAPFGPENMQPIFATRNVKDNGWGKGVGEEKNHAKLCIKKGDGQDFIDAIGFFMGEAVDLAKQGEIHICYHLEENTWNGVTKPQLRLLDVKSALAETSMKGSMPEK